MFSRIKRKLLRAFYKRDFDTVRVMLIARPYMVYYIESRGISGWMIKKNLPLEVLLSTKKGD